MNSIKRLIVVSFAILTPVLGVCAGEAPAANPFTGAMKTASTVDAASRTRIQAGVDSLFASLVTASPEQARVYRELLSTEIKTGPGVSSAFQAAFAEAIAARAPRAFSEAKDLQVKLNIAIIVGRVAEYSGSAVLEPAVRAVLGEKNSLLFTTWGVRAARFIMPELHKAGNSAEMIALVVDAAGASPSGPAFDEAYEALRIPEGNAKIVPVLADALLTLADIRIGQYRTGVPEDPYLELKPLGYLGAQSAWSALTPALRQRWMQTTINLLVYGAARADETKGTGNRAQIANAINNVCKTLVVVSSINRADSNWSALSQIANRTVTLTGATSIPDSLNMPRTVAEIPPAILKIPDFKNLEIPESPNPLK